MSMVSAIKANFLNVISLKRTVQNPFISVLCHECEWPAEKLQISQNLFLDKFEF